MTTQQPAYEKKKYKWWSHEKVKEIGLLADYLKIKKHQNDRNFKSSTAVELMSGSESVSTLKDASRFGVVLLFSLRFPD